jgi:hypothetical protein
MTEKTKFAHMALNSIFKFHGVSDAIKYYDVDNPSAYKPLTMLILKATGPFLY